MIKFLDLQSQYQSIKGQIDEIVLEILGKGAFVGGEYVERFEREFAQEVGSQYALGVGNGTDAIELALKALDLPLGSEVILPVNTFFGSLEGIVNAGLKPVFVDCGEDYCIDVKKIESKITHRTSAIMPVHLYGRVCEMEPILELSRQYGLKVIEDCAQSYGAEIEVFGEKKYAGNIGDVGCFSFYPGKNLGAYGDGGAITTSCDEVFERARSLANHGRGKSKYEHLRIGRNSRLDGIQAGVLSVKLRHIKQWNETRRENARLYHRYLEGLDEFLVLPVLDQWERSVWHLYVVRLKQGDKRKAFMEFLHTHGVECGIHYPFPLSQEEEFRAKEWSENIVSLPMGEHLGEEEISRVADLIKQFIRKDLMR